MEINVIDIQGVNMGLINEYMSSAKEMLWAIKCIATECNHTSIAVLAQRAFVYVENIGSIVEESTQNRKENQNG